MGAGHYCKSFEINISLIHNMFGIPKKGLVYQSWQFNFVKATHVIFEDETLAHYIDYVSQLSMCNQLLHLICVYILISNPSD